MKLGGKCERESGRIDKSNERFLEWKHIVQVYESLKEKKINILKDGKLKQNNFSLEN